MVKKIIQREESVCDYCGSDDCVYMPCLGCGKDACYDCAKTHHVKYEHAVNCSGSGDGCYCNECDEKLREDPLHKAYVAVKMFRQFLDEQYKKNRVRTDEIELDVKRQRAANGLR